MTDSTEFTCKCKKKAGWISDGKETSPCPNCGRVYVGKYNKKTFTIDAIQIRDSHNKRGKE